jgi:hypothetical protein
MVHAIRERTVVALEVVDERVVVDADVVLALLREQ